MGMKIGRYAFVNTEYLSDPCLITLGDDVKDKAYRGLVSFDTSALPDAAVPTRVTLKLTRTSVTGTSPFATHGTCVVDIQSPYFGTGAGLANADWQAAADASAVATVPEPNANGDQVSATLTAAAFPFVNTTGKTQLRIRFTVDDNDDLSVDTINFASSDHGTASYRPVLEVDY